MIDNTTKKTGTEVLVPVPDAKRKHRKVHMSMQFLQQSN